jgi:hypothetical protein
MPRLPDRRMRIGAHEKREITQFIQSVKAYRFRWSMKGDGENAMNERLMNVLLQKFDVINRSIPSTILFGETFRPEFYLRFNKKPLLAIECKVLNDRYAKGRWKEGLSQAIHYSHLYKSTVFLLYDFTNDGRYCKALGRGNKLPSKLAKRMREDSRIYIIGIKPFDRSN